MMLAYVIALPVITFCILYVNREKLNQLYIMRYIILLYQGLDTNRYYWELVNTFRKITLLCMHVFIANEKRLYKALFGCMALFTLSLIQGRLQPYKISTLNQLEYREMMATVLTLYSGAIYLQDDEDNDMKTEIGIFQITFFVVVIIANARFIALWIYCVSCVYRKYAIVEHFARWYKMTLCLSIPLIDEEILGNKYLIATTEDERSSGGIIHYRSTINLKRNTSMFTSKMDMDPSQTIKTCMKKPKETSLYSINSTPAPRETGIKKIYKFKGSAPTSKIHK